ncbi:hypothetical protein [Luteibaculum oceani]|uniref:Uncharacterized protein n=1 Tax=Luteibaculum oceani TaxID=1294296 RepID=A0A5C6V126_9FLAO|nr:hypothetical protein [Luteibaculum oceani]TXC76978.1 hypothetical protein FRX97_10220 [Luteibaculum oceani]
MTGAFYSYRSNIIALLLFTFLGIQGIEAQYLREVPRSKKEYWAAVESAIKDANPDYYKEVIEEEFLPFWEAPGLSASVEEFIYDASEKMVKKRFPITPHFTHLLISTMRLKNGAGGGGNFEAFTNSVLELADGRSKNKLSDYLETTFLLTEQRVIYQSNAVKWSVGNADYELFADTLHGIKFSNNRLVCTQKADSMQLEEVEGILSPTQGVFYGEKAKVTWERVGLDPSTNYADLKGFEIKLRSSFYDADNATLVSEYFPQSLTGKFTDKVVAIKDPSDAKYPAFVSNEKSVEIKDILPDVDYRGGFALKGANFSGLGDPLNRCQLRFKQNGKVFVEANSIGFYISPDRLSSSLAEVKVILGSDSIYHSGAIFKYDREKELLEILRGDEGISYSPFFSSYHQLDIYVDRIAWNRGNDYVEFGQLKSSAATRATFESSNFFDPKRFQALQMPGQPSPLIQLRGYSNKMHKLTFRLDDFAAYVRYPIVDAKVLIISLANKGFLYYDIDTEMITLKDKMFDFILANGGKVDYDVLLMDSYTGSTDIPNGKLDLNNYNLDLFGVKKVALSDTQSVSIYLDKRSEYLRVKKNRDLEFDGVLKAGNFDLYGDSFQFNYEKFQVEIPKADSALMYLQTYSQDGRMRFTPIRTPIYNITGTLFIDNPLNKSGLNADKAQYPVLETTEDAFTYYEKPSVQGGAYKKDEFYFKINPITLDSLDNFSKSAFRMPGTLVSAGIFPDINDSLIVMEDYSLGFKYKAPEGGLPMYGNVAKFDNNITLSDEGLQGDGMVEYVTSKSYSKRFNFLPDSTYALAQKIENVKQKASPDVPDFNGQDFGFTLFAGDKESKLVAKTIKTPLNMFANQAQQVGDLTLRPAGLEGSGSLSMFKGKVISDRFTYNNANAFADTADFELKSIDEKVLAIETQNVQAHIDFTYKVGNFTANDINESKVTFPKNQYVAFMDNYKWLIEDEKIEMSSTRQSAAEDSTSLASKLVSIHPDKDSLQFVAPLAVYDIKENVIRAEKVEKITVADAFIEPDGGKVNILANAEMETLQNATITADYINQFHTIFEASVDVVSRKKYLGRGKYDYEDEFGKKQVIEFEDISIDTGGHTFAVGTIPEEQDFKLNSYFDYKGNVMLMALQKGLNFSGSTRLQTNCDRITRNWLVFKGQVDPKNALIPITGEMKNDAGEKLAAGIVLNNDQNQIYPTFISRKINPTDAEITKGAGYLWYDDASSSYMIGSKSRNEGGKEGNVIALNTKTCNISSQGEFDFGIPLGQVKLAGLGETKYTYSSGKTELKGLVTVDFFFDKKMLGIINNQIKEFPFLQPMNIATSNYVEAAKAWVGGKDAEQLEKSLNEKGMLDKIPESMQKSYVLADLNFVWDTAQVSWVTNSPIGIASIDDVPVFAKMRGKMQVMKSKRGNELNLYYELDPQQWYYYRYKFDEKPRMQTYSPNEEYMGRLNELKDKDKELSVKKGEPEYLFEMATRTSKSAFLERFE